MKFSNKVNISNFFAAIADEVYCIVKLDKALPSYQSYSDIDVFCYDINKLVRAALKFGNDYANKGFKIKVNEVSENQVHVDFYAPGEDKLDIRFDFMQSLGAYEKINVKPALFSSILENRVPVEQNNLNVFVPAPMDDLLLRYIEFVEYYDIRADKIKHAEYINDYATKLDKKEMLDKLHFYTKLPVIVSNPEEISAKSKTKKLANRKRSISRRLKNLRRKIIQVRFRKGPLYLL